MGITSPGATHPKSAPVIAVILLIGLTACQQEDTDWIEVPLQDATFFDGQREFRQGNYEILVLANSALEYKLGLDEGDSMTYQWQVDMGQPDLLTAEFHGHTHRVNEEPGTVMFYKIHEDGEENGTLVAPFDGIHGWYFDNRSGDDIIIELTVSGFYEVLE